MDGPLKVPHRGFLETLPLIVNGRNPTDTWTSLNLAGIADLPLNLFVTVTPVTVKTSVKVIWNQGWYSRSEW